MRAIVSSALLLLAVIFLTVILGYRGEGMCGCGGKQRPFYVGYEGFAGPMGQLYPKLDYRSSEGFGTSPGTMTQLATSHVPSESDAAIIKQWLADRKEGVYMMTEEDLKHGAPMTPLRIGAFN
jgi:hypothetical protein